jgi:hypothetical protein
MSYCRLLIAEVISRWDQLLPEDLEPTPAEGPLLAALLEKRYGFCRDRAECEAQCFFADFADRLRRAAAA